MPEELPTMVPVKSSNLAAVGHANEKLYIRFKQGVVYKYHGVSSQAHQALMRAPSQGSHFARFIKGHYPETQLT